MIIFLQIYPKLLGAPCLENKNAKIVSCGARHSAIITGSIAVNLITACEGKCVVWGSGISEISFRFPVFY